MITIENVNTTDTQENGFMEGLAITAQFTTLDEFSMLPVLCLLIDTAAAKRGEDPEQTLDQIREAVIAVNRAEGRYNPYQFEEGR